MRKTLMGVIALCLVACSPSKAEAPAVKDSVGVYWSTATDQQLAQRLINTYRECLALQKQLEERDIKISLEYKTRASLYDLPSLPCSTAIDEINFRKPLAVNGKIKGEE